MVGPVRPGAFEPQGFLRIMSGFAKSCQPTANGGFKPPFYFAMVNLTGTAAAPASRNNWEVSVGDREFRALTRDQAARLRLASPPLSPWTVLLVQFGTGTGAALLAWALTGRQGIGWSAFYGVLAVVLPGAMFARGLTGRLSSINPATAVAGFFVWEMAKMVLTAAMLFAAATILSDVSWPALLAGLVVTMKAAWLAVIFAARRNNFLRQTH